jgi:hypothetical protein
MLRDLEPIIIPFGEIPDITIIPVYDLHIGSEHFDKGVWERFVSQLQKADNTYFVLGGDCLDFGITNSMTLPYEQTMRPREQKAYLAETLAPIKDKCLCGISGNHEYRGVKAIDDNPLFDVFAKLDIEDRYRENGAFLFMSFGKRKTDNGTDTDGKNRPFYCMMVHHGTGGGMYIGSQTYKQERYASMVEGLDILVTGHTHKPITFPGAKLVCDPRNKKVTVKEFRVITANAWLDYGGYAMRKMLPPTSKTMTEIYLDGTRKSVRISQ